LITRRFHMEMSMSSPRVESHQLATPRVTWFGGCKVQSIALSTGNIRECMLPGSREDVVGMSHPRFLQRPHSLKQTSEQA
jgi:hypothetical protein